MFTKNLTVQILEHNVHITFGEEQESFLNSYGFTLALSSSFGDFKIFSGLWVG